LADCVLAKLDPAPLAADAKSNNRISGVVLRARREGGNISRHLSKLSWRIIPGPRRTVMRSSLKGVLRALACVFGLLAQPLQSLALDNSNAAKVDATTWANMNQVMAGTSLQTPDQLKNPTGILFPQGIYVVVLAGDLYSKAQTANPENPDLALTQYFSLLLGEPEVAGLLFSAAWSNLNPNDPTVYPTASTANCPATPSTVTTAGYVWNILDDAFCAIKTWNKENLKAPPKTLQLVIQPGFNSPGWLFSSYLSPCDFLFETPLTLPSNPSDCGYTNIFLKPESKKKTQLPFPLPWNSIYKTKWLTFLQNLNEHITDSNAEAFVVSIAVAGPTATSAEMILPNRSNNPDTLTVPAAGIPSGYSAAVGVTANSAWNCLLANYYGAMPASGASYLNSDRAFIEEWAAAIDTFGTVFSGMTLVVTTGNGLPDFSNETGGPVPGCGLGVLAPVPSTIAAPQAFLPDCAVQPPHNPPFPMDCAAEAAILAYFAEPPVGGPNAKATEEDALAAGDDVDSSLLTLSNASVKWLSATTRDGLQAVTGNPLSPGSMPVLSRMLGGLQFGEPVSTSSDTAFEGCPYRACKDGPAGYCAPAPGSTGGCTPLSSTGASVEQALLNVLQVYFAGTFWAGNFGAPPSLLNNTVGAPDAPMSYLQVWDTDILYAAGFGKCTVEDLMASPPKLTCKKSLNSMHTVPLGGVSYNAQGLLKLAGKYIPMPQTALLPLFGYDFCSNNVCGCYIPYAQRGAFGGDDVCVSTLDQSDAATENVPENYIPNYSNNETISVPYGPCAKGLVWRQAHMGDYVCVTMPQATAVAGDNLHGWTHACCTCPPSCP
jgi:hypothetical protein